MTFTLPTWVSSIADILGILGFLISIFVANKVNNINKNSNTINANSSSIGGDFVGRDKNS